METQLSEVFQATLYLTGNIAPFVLVAFFILKKWGKTTLAESKQSDEQQYNEKYAEIEEQIRVFYICHENKELLESHFEKLESLEYKNPEKTEILRIQFMKKYQRLVRRHEQISSDIRLKKTMMTSEEYYNL